MMHCLAMCSKASVSIPITLNLLNLCNLKFLKCKFFIFENTVIRQTYSPKIQL